MYVGKGSKYISAAVSISCIVIKKNVKISHTNTNLFKEFSTNTLYLKHTSDFLQLSQKQNNLKINSLTENFLRLNIFSIYFPLKLIFFTVQMYLFD